MEEKLKRRSTFRVEFTEEEINLRVYVTATAAKRALVAVLLVASAVLGINVQQLVDLIRGLYGY